MECGCRVSAPSRSCCNVVALSPSDTCAYDYLSDQALPPNSGSSISYPCAPGCTVPHRFIASKFFDVLNMGKCISTAKTSALGCNVAMSMGAHQQQPGPGTATSAGEPQGDLPAGGVGPGLGCAQAEEIFQAEVPTDADRPPLGDGPSSTTPPTTPAASAGEPLGDSPAGEAGGAGEPPPPPPPDPPREFERGERIGVEELKSERTKTEEEARAARDAGGQILGVPQKTMAK